MSNEQFLWFMAGVLVLWALISYFTRPPTLLGSAKRKTINGDFGPGSLYPWTLYPSKGHGMAQKQLVKMDLKKVGLETFIDLKVDPEIESFFREASKEGGAVQTEVSSKWFNDRGEGLQFYRKSAKMSDKVQDTGSYEVIDNFGNGLMEFRRGDQNYPTINVALLRAVGASGGISVKVDDLISYDETKKYMQLLGSWIKQFYIEYLQGRAVEATVSIEI